MRLPRPVPILLVCASLAAATARGESVALLPLENLSASPEAASRLGSLIASRLSKKGWTVVSGEPVETVLDQLRVRYLDSLTSADRARLASALGGPVLALGTVYAYDATVDPRVALGFRLISADGRVRFSDLIAMRSEDAEGVFDFDTARTREEIAGIAVDRLLERLPAPGAAAAELRRRGVPVHLSAPRTYRSIALADGPRHRIAILPFASAGPHEAARIVAELLARRLSASKLFEVVEPADFRSAFVDEKIHDLSDPAEIRRLGKRLGTTLFLKGTIYEFSEPSQASSGSPRLELAAALTDYATNEIVWTSFVSRRGTDYRGLLQLGSITSVVGLADQAAAEMISSVEGARARSRVSSMQSGLSKTQKDDAR